MGARRLVPRRQVSADVHLPAPVGGLNTVSAGTAMPAADCTRLYNMIPADYGLRARLGYREHFTGLAGSSDSLVRTVIPYIGANGAATSKLFVTTSNGIYDATTSRAGWESSTSYAIGDVVVNDDGKVYTCDTNGTSASSGGPTGTGANIADGSTRWDYTSTTKVVAFGTVTGNAGYGTYHAFTNNSGPYLYYADEVNGLYQYAANTSTWATGAAAGITGVNPNNVVFVGAFKRRLCFLDGTARWWYMTTAEAIAGAAAELYVGAYLKQGGNLRAFYNWTIDGGAGIDDALVIVSDAGEIVIYQGVDPGTATDFKLRGVWRTGGVVSGRQVGTDLGGDLLLLTKAGIQPLSKLVAGGQEGLGQYTTGKIANTFNTATLSVSDLRGWSLRIHPEDNTLVCTVPTVAGEETTQLAMSLANGGWAQYRDLPIYSSAVWSGKLYFGTADGRVCINDGYVDDVDIDATTYTAVQWAVLTSFQNMGNSRQKRVHNIRPVILAENSSPDYSVGARYDFDFTELDPVSGGTVGDDEWDGALWDDGVWAGEYQATTETNGAVGVGVSVAMAARGTATSRTVLVGFDLQVETGGFL